MVTISIFTPGGFAPPASAEAAARLAEAPSAPRRRPPPSPSLAGAPCPAPLRRGAPLARLSTGILCCAQPSTRSRRDVQIQEPLRRIDYDPRRRRIDADTDVGRHRDLYLSALPLHHESTSLHRSFHRADTTQERIRPIAHLTSDELVMVKR